MKSADQQWRQQSQHAQRHAPRTLRHTQWLCRIVLHHALDRMESLHSSMHPTRVKGNRSNPKLQRLFRCRVVEMKLPTHFYLALAFHHQPNSFILNFVSSQIQYLEKYQKNGSKMISSSRTINSNCVLVHISSGDAKGGGEISTTLFQWTVWNV